MMRILFYGDSNTWGYNAQTGMRYANRFTKQIQKAFNVTFSVYYLGNKVVIINRVA